MFSRRQPVKKHPLSTYFLAARKQTKKTLLFRCILHPKKSKSSRSKKNAKKKDLIVNQPPPSPSSAPPPLPPPPPSRAQRVTSGNQVGATQALTPPNTNLQLEGRPNRYPEEECYTKSFRLLQKTDQTKHRARKAGGVGVCEKQLRNMRKQTHTYIDAHEKTAEQIVDTKECPATSKRAKTKQKKKRPTTQQRDDSDRIPARISTIWTSGCKARKTIIISGRSMAIETRSAILSVSNVRNYVCFPNTRSAKTKKNKSRTRHGGKQFNCGRFSLFFFPHVWLHRDVLCKYLDFEH